MKNANAVVHFEMPTKDKKRVAEFYKNAFNWEMQIMGPEFGEYVLAMTAKSDKDGPLEKGAINGGFFEKKDEAGFDAPHVVIQVENLEESTQKVKDAGGEVMGEPLDIPGVGNYISFKDSEENIVGMLQPPTSEGQEQ